MTHRDSTILHAGPRAGDLVDLAESALVRWWTGTERHDLHVHEIQPDADGHLRPGRDPDSGDWHIGLEWPEPRDVCQVVVRYAGEVPPDLWVQYWRKNWPTPAPERRPGAGRGWIGQDDPWHGQWTTVRAEKVVEEPSPPAPLPMLGEGRPSPLPSSFASLRTGSWEGEGATCTFTFDPLDLPELGWEAAAHPSASLGTGLEQAEHYLARFRRTLKVRLVSRGEEQPLIAGIHAYSTSRWREGRVDVRFAVGQSATADWSGRAEISNGHILGVEPLDFAAGDHVGADGAWRCLSRAQPRDQVEGQAKGVRLRILYAGCDPTSGERTVVTLRTQARSFSFLVTDLERGPLYIQDYGVFITWAEEPADFTAFQAHLAAAPRSIYERVLDEPEQSLARAMAEIPPLDVTKQNSYGGLGRYVVLGVEAGRQEFALRYNGELFVDKLHLKLMGRDAARLRWPGHQLRFRFASGDPPDFHERRDDTRQAVLDGWLPVVTSQWLDREIEYTETAFAALLDGPMTGPEARRGDEDVVAMLRFAIRNTTHGRKRARLWLALAPQEQIALQGGLVIAFGRSVPAEPVARQWRVELYDAPCLRCAVDTAGRGTLAAVAYADEPGASHAIPTAVVYDVDLDGGEAHTITLAVPFASLAQEEDWRRVAALDLDAKLADVVTCWRRYVEAGGQIDVPDGILADFHKAARIHVALSADKDPASGLVVVPAATWSYGACANEACWQITMLDQAGHHERAETYLETFLRTQGVLGLDGKFASAAGALQGLDIDDGVPVRSGFGYNLDHGCIMECLAHHYRVTGDRAWLERVTPNLIAACDFVIRERAGTQVYGPDGQPVPEWGLLPAGHLEDNPEWRHWFAVNAHACGGMNAIAELLAEVGHAEAERLVQEAKAYRKDIQNAARRAMVEAPAVRLLDGTCVPHVPPRTGLRGRERGWFREAAYGALHLLEGGVFDPDEEEMTWVLKDLEDNLFVSREWGRPVDLERYWFSHGGVTIQPNLMDLGIDYLRRGQVEHALRALFNNFGASLYPDVRVFTEHPVVELGHGVGPFYKSSDEAKALVWLRAFLLDEEGDTLHLARGVPRAWLAAGQSFGVRGMASSFGPLTYRVQSSPTEVTVEVKVPTRRPPRELAVHLRRPGRPALRAVMVNGQPHGDFDPLGETVRVTAPSGVLVIRASTD